MLFIGIDISKISFNVSILNDKNYSDHQFKNNESGFKAFVKKVSKFKSNSVFCLESTGIYSLGLATFLHQKKCTVILVNPMNTHALENGTLPFN